MSELIETYTCQQKCCKIEVTNTSTQKNLHRIRRGQCRKAGVFIYDPEKNSVLLVQSRGQLWGMPKGTLEIDKNENSYECAVREVKEETGIDISAKDFSRATKVKNRAVYYYAEIKSAEIHIQRNAADTAEEYAEKNDANGITWIKIPCLYDCVKTGQIVLNQHCLIVFKRFLNIIFPSVEFTRVEHKKRRSRIEKK